jgi:hypothetical protein
MYRCTKIGRPLLGPWLKACFSMSTSYSLAKAQSCQTINQNLVLLFVFSFSSFVKATFGAFVRIFI